MAMHISSSETEGDPDVLVDINTTPLIDVMLVLLIMLIITIPVKLDAVNLDLPDDNAPPVQPDVPPEVVRIDITADGRIRWNDEELLPDAALDAKLAAVAKRPVQPELHVRPDRQASYKYVAKVFSAAQRNGLVKIGILGQEQYHQ